MHRPTHSTGNSSETQPCAAMLEVHNITAGYPGNRSAIEDISFEVQAGERVAIIGPNGAGKTTLFKTLIGLIPHRAGYISLYGRDCRTSHTLLGYVPQHEGIDWDFPASVYDVVMMGRTRQIGWLRWPQRVDREMVYHALEQVGMCSFANHRLNELSGGQKRRVFIARSLAQETDLLLLDEPFSGVDVAAEDEILDVLDRLSTQGIAILLATHNLDVAAARFDRLLLLKGRVIAFGFPADVFRPELLKAAYGDRVAIFERNGTSIIVADQH